MKGVFTFCSIVILCATCGPAPENKRLSYKNIVILSDMSSRISNLPPKDFYEIRRIVQYFKNECVKPGEKIGDKSSICFSAFSGEIAASIDINKMNIPDSIDPPIPGMM